MKYKRGNSRRTAYGTAVRVRTTIMELLHALSDLTKDDRRALSAFKYIFESYNGRLAHSRVPVQLFTPQLKPTKRKFVR